jgi:uncharacterized protein YbcC (UPF0753/DUF2309 family)
MKTCSSAFGYVEGAGLFYGMSLIARTLAPGYLYRFNKNNTYESVCEPQIRNTCTSEQTHLDIPLAEKVAIVKALLI